MSARQVRKRRAKSKRPVGAATVVGAVVLAGWVTVAPPVFGAMGHDEFTKQVGKELGSSGSPSGTSPSVQLVTPGHFAITTATSSISGTYWNAAESRVELFRA